MNVESVLWGERTPLSRQSEKIVSAAASLRIAMSMNLNRYGDAEFRFSAIAARAIRYVLPYCLHPTEDQCSAKVPDRFIILNRDYKPIGLAPAVGHVDYRSYDDCIVIKREALFDELWGRAPHASGNARFFFQDHTAPWRGKREAEKFLRLLYSIDVCANVDARDQRGAPT